MESCLRLNHSFHRFYVRSAANETLKQAVRPMIKRVVGLWAATAYRQDPELFAATIREHDGVLRAFAAARRARRRSWCAPLWRTCWPGGSRPPALTKTTTFWWPAGMSVAAY